MYELDFVHYDLGFLEKGTIVAVFLDAAANVCILDVANFIGYKNGYSFKYLGGYVTRSPYYFTIPKYEHWHVAIDLGGYEGCIGSSIKIIPPKKLKSNLLLWVIQL